MEDCTKDTMKKDQYVHSYREKNRIMGRYVIMKQNTIKR